MWRPLQRAVEKLMTSALVRANLMKYGSLWSREKVGCIKVMGLDKDRHGVREALEWVDSISRAQHDNLQEAISIIACSEHIGSHTVMPSNRVIWLVSESNDIHKEEVLGGLLIASSNYVSLCHSVKKFRSCKAEDLLFRNG